MRLLEKNRDMRPASARVLIQEIEKVEKDLSSPGRTRVLTADDLIRTNDSRGPTGGDRGAERSPLPPRPPTPPVRPVEPPKPVPPPVVRPQPQVV